MEPSSMRHLSIAAFLTAAFLLSIFMFPWWAAAAVWFAIAVVGGTSLFLRQIEEE
jgi:hypothetical protein